MLFFIIFKIMKRPLSDYSCLNEKCSDHGKRGADNIIVAKHYGKRCSIRLLKCKTCKTHFSERKNTALSHCKIDLESALDIIHHLSEGNGIRRTSRLTGKCKGTVSRLAKLSGDQSASIHDELVRDLAVNDVELDEKWSFVGKKGQAAKK